LKSDSNLNGELASLRDFFAYNKFVRKKYFRFLSKLPKNTLTKDRGASFSSLLDIYTHVLDAYYCWFLAYETGGICKRWQYSHETGKDDFEDLKGLSLNEIRKLEREVERRIDDVMHKLKPEDLTKSFQFIMGSGKNSKTLSRNVGYMLWHLVEEELQHRGEMNALLWQDDIDPPITGWFRWKKAVERKLG
jgi:uncharacterized damage-inducible protein DinB